MSETRSAAETIYPNAAAETPAPAETAAPETASPEAPTSETEPTLLTETPAEEKPEEPAEPPPEPFAADKITFPEGVTADPEVFGKFSKIAETEKLSLSTSQQLIDLWSEIANVQTQKNWDAWKTTREGWVAAVKAHPEIGGNNLPGVVRDIARVFDNPEFAHPKLKEGLEVTGAGDHEAIIYTFWKLAKAVSEGTHVSGEAPSRRAPRSLAEVMYPNLTQPER